MALILGVQLRLNSPPSGGLRGCCVKAKMKIKVKRGAGGAGGRRRTR